MTLDLPRALEPWRSVLEIFAVEVAPSIGDLVARLSVLVGPLERDSASARGEPDGVSGIGRRGPFNRLLATDWALLHEVPDEFLRRAAEQQLSFFEIARREPSADRRSIALFDAGGTQLGGPRVVHLAALVLLAQRAIDANARFSWGILHDPETVLHDGLTPASAFVLLRARRREIATDEDAARWARILGARDAKTERELWIIGGARTPDPGPGFPHARLVTDDCLDPAHGNAIEVAITTPRRPRRAARIEIPPPETSVRLLRDPFEVKKKTKALGALRTATVGVLGPGAFPFVLGTTGRKLFTRGEEGALVTLPIGGQNSDGPPRAYLPRTGDAVIAVGQKGKHTIIASRCAGELTVEGVSRRGHGTRWSAVVRGPSPIDLGGDLAREPLCELFPLRRHDALLFHGSRLSLLPHGPEETEVKEAQLVVPAYRACRDGASVIVITREETPRLLRCTIGDDRTVHTDAITLLPRGAGERKVLLDATLFAYQEEDGAFRILHHRSPVGPRVKALPDDEVIGLHTNASERRLVVIDGARRAIVLVNEAGVRTTAVEIEAGIEHAQLPTSDERRRDIAIFTRASAIEIHSFEARGAIVRHAMRVAR